MSINVCRPSVTLNNAECSLLQQECSVRRVSKFKLRIRFLADWAQDVPVGK